jgi:esterase/lipase superfamily enzyme
VLIFFPGFNCPLKNALEGFGQLLAMTKLDSQVYPILFNWPAGQVLTYYSSSRAAHSKKNYNNFCQLLNGLRHEGFRNVHLMSHSMGAQTLLGALADKKDGSRSDSSLCFALASDYDEGKQQQDEEERGLFCKTITLLNPDFPLVPFQEHAFPAARKLCRTITVVGDKLDVALFWSQVLNGIAIRVGYEQPHALLPNDDCKNKFQHCQTVGRNVGSLYFPEDVVYRRTIGKQDNLLFKHKAPHVSLYCEEKASEKAWMDLDVVDTTDLDNNMQKIRHSAYNLNPSLFNDLEELITTGKRAMDRSLMYRDGNVFSYCSAPSFVNM